MLTDKHLTDLHSSGLSDEIIELSQVYSCSGSEGNKLLDRSDLQCSCLVFPYHRADGDNRDVFYRLKPDTPPKGGWKYLQKYKSESRLYVLPQVWLRLADLDQPLPLLWVEGEKKTLKAYQELFSAEGGSILPIGIGGVDNWGRTTREYNEKTKRDENKKILIRDLDNLNVTNRTCYICFDSNIADNPNVADAEARLSDTLIVKNASRVASIRIPHDGTKHGVGLDDYIIKEGKSNFEKLITEASSSLLVKKHIKFLRNIPNIKPADRMEAVAAMVLKDQKNSGGFYNDTDRAFYFANNNRELIELLSDRYQLIIGDGYGLFRGDKEFKAVMGRLEEEAVFRGEHVEIKTFSHYDQGNLYIYNNKGGIYTINNVDGVCLHYNGYDKILFRYASGDEIIYKEECKGYLKQYLLDIANFQKSEHTALTHDQQMLLFQVWLYSVFFPNKLPTKPILTMTGDYKSGKSTIQRLVGKILLGRTFNVTMLQKERDFLSAVTADHYLVYDNVDVNTDWVRNAICSLATGFTIKLRRLFTTNEQYTATPICFLAINSMTQSIYKRPDVASRLLIFRTKAIGQNDMIPEEKFHRDVYQFRNEILSEIFDNLKGILKYITNDYPYKGGFRMADFANLGYMIATALGKEQEFNTVLQIVSQEQATLPLEDDPLIDFLEKWLALGHHGQFVSTGELYGELKKIADDTKMAFPFRSSVGLGKMLMANLSNLQNIFDIEVRKGSANKTMYNFSYK